MTNFPSDFFGGCNAAWDGRACCSPTPVHSTGCSNTGELASVVAHEWAHGLDDNDANGQVSNPGEGFADVLAAFWTGDSCIGRGFFQGTNCSTPALPDGSTPASTATVCARSTGASARTADAVTTSRSSTPHARPTSRRGGPCGGSVHCEGHLVVRGGLGPLASRPAWTGAALAPTHDRRSRPPGSSYVGSGLVGDWFQCTPEGDRHGCNADGGYLNLLAADDDNGDLTDGTPHMSALFAAFDRHGIACTRAAGPGCRLRRRAPDGARSDRRAARRGGELSWTAVPGATSYEVFRTEGVVRLRLRQDQGRRDDRHRVRRSTACSTASTLFTVAPVGLRPMCLGPMSACTSVTAGAGGPTCRSTRPRSRARSAPSGTATSSSTTASGRSSLRRPQHRQRRAHQPHGSPA